MQVRERLKRFGNEAAQVHVRNDGPAPYRTGCRSKQASTQGVKTLRVLTLSLTTRT